MCPFGWPFDVGKPAFTGAGLLEDFGGGGGSFPKLSFEFVETVEEVEATEVISS